MKKLFIIAIAVFASMTLFANTDGNSGLGFNYQAVVRNADGVLLANSNVTLRVSLYPGQTAITPTWVETHTIQTDISGAFGITVGHGTRVASSIAANYADINFAAVYYWMKIEVMEGSNYREVSFAQLPSVPYCEVAHNATTVPAGCIIPFAGPVANIPSGWMLCDGTAISRSTYANLYNAIGVAWGTGDGSTTFNIPDLRGMFLRGAACGDTINDPNWNTRMANGNGGNNTDAGSTQGYAQPNVTGMFSGVESSVVTTGPFYPTTYRNWGCGKSDTDNVTIGFDLSRCVPTSTEIRPKNVAVTYIIKY